jgi:Domain of unknown function (DUF4397)
MKLPRTALRFVMPVAMLSLAPGFLAAAPSVASASTASQGTGWIRLAHLSPNTPAVDVYLYSFGDPSAHIVLKHVGYGAVSPYEPVTGGSYSVAMRPAGASPSSSPVLSASVRVASGSAYTVAGLGPASGLRLQVLSDKLTSPPGRALVRVIQASLKEHNVTVTDGKVVLAPQLAFATVTGYRTVSPGQQHVRVAGASDKVTQSVDLSADTIHTLVVLDGKRGLKLDSLEDAAGNQVMPVGGAGTGLGGAAGSAHGGTSPSRGSTGPWALGIAAGILFALAGALRLHRIRAAAGRVR